MAGCHREKCHRRRKVQVPVGRLLCEVSGECLAVGRMLLDREVRGRLITILRGKAEVLYMPFVACGLGFPAQRSISKGCWRWQR